jgi:thiol-disulfide isomerase/thioredoxin
VFTFSIKGHISPVLKNYIILRKESDIEKKISEIVDTIKVSKNGDFKKEFNLPPYLYTLQLDDKKNIPLAININQHLDIKITKADSEKFKTVISGSKDSEILQAYESFREQSLDSLVKSVRRKVKAIKEGKTPDTEKIIALEQQEVENYEKHLTDLNAFIKKNINNTLGLYATSIRWAGSANLVFYDSITTAFELAHPNLEISKKLREKVTRLQQTAIGGTAPNIIMNTPEGKSISLYDVHKKYTLIDFWASWCGPCRSESTTLNMLYDTYNNKGFEIYGIALDDKRDKWVKAIEKDNRNWTNVSSLEKFKTKSAFDFAVTALPMNFLIDEDHRIIGKNLHQDELIQLVNDLFSDHID